MSRDPRYDILFEPVRIGPVIEAVCCIGDRLAPGLIAHAVYSGHRHAREFDAVTGESHADADVAFRRQRWSPAPG